MGSKVVKIRENIDSDGVVERSTTVTTIAKLPPEPEYVKLYIDDIGHLKGIQPGHREILLYIAASVGYDGFVTLTLARKARIAATVGQAVRSVDNAITALVKAKIMHRAGRCEYELNPSLFAKGEWHKIRERRDAFNLRVSYSATAGRVIEGVAVTDELDDRPDERRRAATGGNPAVGQSDLFE